MARLPNISGLNAQDPVGEPRHGTFQPEDCQPASPRGESALIQAANFKLWEG